MSVRIVLWDQMPGHDIELDIKSRTAIGESIRTVTGTVIQANSTSVHIKNLKFVNVPKYFAYSASSGRRFGTPTFGRERQAEENGFGLRTSRYDSEAYEIQWRVATLTKIHGTKLHVLYGPNIRRWPHAVLYGHFFSRSMDKIQSDPNMVEYVRNYFRQPALALDAIRLCRDAQLEPPADSNSPEVQKLFTY